MYNFEKLSTAAELHFSHNCFGHPDWKYFQNITCKIATLHLPGPALMWPDIFSIENHVKTLRLTVTFNKRQCKESINPKRKQAHVQF